MAADKQAPSVPRPAAKPGPRAVVPVTPENTSAVAAPTSPLVSMMVGHYGPGPVQRRAGSTAAGKAEDAVHYARGPLQRRAMAAPATIAGPTGLPLGLRAGLEALSGFSLDHVRVHYNSTRPAALNALAYAQGSDIHLARGQERHLPHEAWHVVQQRQGRVRGNLSSGGAVLNDDAALEREADLMGARMEPLLRADPVPGATVEAPNANPSSGTANVLQRVIGPRAEGKLVVQRGQPEAVYVAQRNKDGSYDLIDRDDGGFLLSIEEDDDDFILLSEHEAARPAREEETPFSVIAKKRKRRVFTYGPKRGSSGFHGLLAAEKVKKRKTKQKSASKKDKTEQEDGKDFSYADVTGVLHDALRRVGTGDEADAAISTGANLPLQDGAIPVDDIWDLDLQLVAFHLLIYQNFHTPPDLTLASRADENPWRQQELDNTISWLELPGAEGAKLILPEERTRLRDYYPGPIDVSFPPGKEDILNYGDNKAIYLLNRIVLLKAYLKGQEQSEEDGGPSARRRLTDAFFAVVGEQEDSIAKGEEEAYVRKTFRLKRTDSESSLDEASSSEDEASDDFDLKQADSLQEGARKRKTYVNTQGLLIKLQNRKILEDLRAKADADNAREVKLADARLKKHRRLLDRLEARYGEVVKTHKGAFEHIAAAVKYATDKLDLVRRIAPSKKKRATRQRYERELEAYLSETPRAGEDDPRPLEGIGVKTLEAQLEGIAAKKRKKGAKKGASRKQDAQASAGTSSSKRRGAGKRAGARKGPAAKRAAPKRKRAAAKSTSSKKPRLAAEAAEPGKKVVRKAAASKKKAVAESAAPGKKAGVAKSATPARGRKAASSRATARKSRQARVQELAEQYGGTAEYGSSDGNNCLIFAIGNALGHDVSEHLASRIRRSLVAGDHIGVTADGFLPGTTRVVNLITQLVLAQLFDQGQPHPPVTVHLVTVIPDIAEVTVGGDAPGDAHAYVIHDGIHFWWVKTD